MNRSKTALRRGRALIPPPPAPQNPTSAQEQDFLLSPAPAVPADAATDRERTPPAD